MNDIIALDEGVIKTMSREELEDALYGHLDPRELYHATDDDLRVKLTALHSLPPV